MTNDTRPLEEMPLEELRELSRKQDEEVERQKLIWKLKGNPPQPDVPYHIWASAWSKDNVRT